jgi:hypothetical protein
VKFLNKILCVTGLLAVLGATPALADDAKPIDLVIQNHKFDPAEIKIPAGRPAILHVTNLDADAEEFDSDDLKTEKVIVGKGEGTIHLHALKPGRYEFEGEYHSDSAHGVLVAE